LAGCGAGIILTLGLTWNQLSSFHLDLYHRQLPIDTVLRAIAIDVVVVSLLCAAFLWLLQRVDGAHRTLLWTLFASILAARVVGGFITAEVITRQWLTPPLVFGVVFAAGCLLWLLRRSWYVAVVRGFLLLLLVAGFSIIWIVPQLFFLSFAKQPEDRLAFTTAARGQINPHRRIVWLLFDEMSYDQLFDHRQNGLAMPNFDRLRAQSVSFSDVTPDGYYTEEVLPSLLLGQPVVEIRSNEVGDLILRNASGSPWKAFDPEATLFADAQRMQLTSGLVGSYNPYCRLLPHQLNECWMQLLLFKDHLSGEKPTMANVLAPAYASVARIFHWPLEHTPTDEEKFKSLTSAATGLIDNENINFAFVHLPVPHPPGIYKRAPARFGPGGSYIDNMALADKTLGIVEAALAMTASASETTVIVSSDHSWRVPMWRNAIGWTAEDERASQGRFDTRPVLLVHLPGQTQPLTVSEPFPALKEHDLIEDLFKNSPTPAGLEGWAEAHR
jgi:hypothetical protein